MSPTWHALDTHAGRRISFVDNVVERSPRAIFITTDGQGNRPMDIEIRGNLFGDPSPVVRNLTAVTTYRADGVTIAGNTAIGWPRGGFYTDFEGQSVDVVMSDNRIVP